MKLLFVFTFFLTTTFTFTFGQVANWYGTDLGTLGYKHNKVSFEKRFNTYSEGSSNTYFKDSTGFLVEGGSFDLAADIFTKHAYFHVDASIIPDLLYTIITKKANGKRWLNTTDGDYEPSIFLPVRLAFGSNITDYFNLYGGGQWQYSRYFFEPSNDNFEQSIIGGNQYGVGVHGMLAIGPVLIRHSYMYDWISRASHFKGKVQTHETILAIGFPVLGFYIKSNFQNRNMFAGTYSENTDAILNSSTEGPQRYYQAQKMKHFTIGVGIYATGLISGTTRGVSKGLSEVEQGLRKERDDKKKRTIEWKEN